MSYESSMYKIYLYSLGVKGDAPAGEKFPFTDIAELGMVLRHTEITRNVLSSALDRSLIEAGFPKGLVRENENILALDIPWSIVDAHPTSGYRKMLKMEHTTPVAIKKSIESGDFTAHKLHEYHRVIYVTSSKNTQKSQREDK